MLLVLQAASKDELKQLQNQLQHAQQAEQHLGNELAQTHSSLSEAQAALSQEQAKLEQQERQLAQMVEAQRRLGLELQEGEEAREQADAARATAEVWQDLLPVSLTKLKYQ